MSDKQPQTNEDLDVQLKQLSDEELNALAERFKQVDPKKHTLDSVLKGLSTGIAVDCEISRRRLAAAAAAVTRAEAAETQAKAQVFSQPSSFMRGRLYPAGERPLPDIPVILLDRCRDVLNTETTTGPDVPAVNMLSALSVMKARGVTPIVELLPDGRYVVLACYVQPNSNNEPCCSDCEHCTPVPAADGGGHACTHPERLKDCNTAHPKDIIAPTWCGRREAANPEALRASVQAALRLLDRAVLIANLCDMPIAVQTITGARIVLQATGGAN